MVDTQTPIVNEDFIVEKFENEILLYTVADTKAIYLNETAHLVWMLCKEDITIGEMIDVLVEQYPDHKDQIRGDVIASLENLIENGVITLADE